MEQLDNYNHIVGLNMNSNDLHDVLIDFVNKICISTSLDQRFFCANFTKMQNKIKCQYSFFLEKSSNFGKKLKFITIEL
jgi:hypothetical protein